MKPGFYWASAPESQWNEISKLSRNWHPPMHQTRLTTGRTVTEVMEQPSPTGDGMRVEIPHREVWGIVELLRPMAKVSWPYPKFGWLGENLTAAQMDRISPQTTGVWDQPDPALIHSLSEWAEGVEETVEDIGDAIAEGAEDLAEGAANVAKKAAFNVGILVATAVGVGVVAVVVAKSLSREA